MYSAFIYFAVVFIYFYLFYFILWKCYSVKHFELAMPCLVVGSSNSATVVVVKAEAAIVLAFE